MASQKHRSKLVELALASIVIWAFTTFSFMVLWWAKGGLAAPPAQRVSAALYESAVEYSRIIIFRAIPALTAGYLFIGLLLLRIAAKAKKDENN